MSKNQDLGELINGIKALATNQLNAPAYTSATAFTGTIAGYLGFDSSGNFLTVSGSSQWITTGSDIYYNTGKVAIGKTSASFALDVNSGTDGTIMNLNSTRVGGGGLSISGNSSARIYLGNANWVGGMGEATSSTAISLAAAENSAIIFARNAAYSTDESMRITSAGRLAIATTSADALLHIGSVSGSNGIKIECNSTAFAWGGSSVYGDFGQLTWDTGVAVMLGVAGKGIAFHTNGYGNERMRITSGGNVGIGLVSPAYKLDVAGDINITGSFRVNGTPIGTGGGGVSGSGSTNYLAKWSAGTALTNSQIYDNGSSIGLRTASPFYVIDYQLTGSLRLGYFIGSIDGTDNASGIVAHNGNGITQTVPFGFSGSKFAWYIGTNEAMRIDTNRNLLINTTGGVTGGGSVQVNGDVNVTGTFRVNGVQYNTGGGGGGISGGGSTNYVPKFTGGASIGDSALYDDGNFSMIIGATGFSSGIFMRASKYLGVYGASSSGIVLRTADGDPNIASVITREYGAGQGLSIYDDRQIWLGQSGLLTVVNISNNAVGIKTPAVGTPYALNLPNDYLNAARAYAWYTYSDARVKRDIEDIKYGINEVMKMKPVKYKHYSSVFENNSWTLENNYTTEIGFVAQDMDKIIREVVNRGSDTELWSLDKSKLIPVLVKAVQELKAELDELKQNNA